MAQPAQTKATVDLRVVSLNIRYGGGQASQADLVAIPTSAATLPSLALARCQPAR